MSVTNDQTIATLNELIETCKDGEEGFKSAAEVVQDIKLREMFKSYAQQRARFVADMQVAIRRLGGDPTKTGSLAGALHRGWMNIKSAVTGKNEDAVIAEAERGEDTAVHTYEKALQAELPLDVQAIVERQYMQVKEAHDRIRALERAGDRLNE
jgi:uncharacterized protein (TIGR02284 family)